jgi:2-oxo-4-hydroxy-4-carboxy--5-ureidoimidazoline (OHCU) decarboxylase
MDVRLPNGTIIRGVPDNFTSDQVRSLALQNELATGADFGMGSDAAGLIPTGGSGMGPTPPVAGRSVEPRTLTQAAMEGAMAVPILGAAARGLQLASRGTRAAPYAAEAVRALLPTSGKALVGEGLLGTVAGVGGELAARQVPEEYGETGKALGGMAGGMVAAAPFSLAKGAMESMSSVPGLFSTTKDLTEQITQAAATGRASKQAITALTANPSLSGNIARAAEIEKSTGITLPMLAQSNGDTTISSYLQSQIARGENVEFTAAVKRQYETAEQALTKAKQGVAPAMQEVDAYVKKKALETSQKNVDVVNKASVMSARRMEGLDNIDSRIVELTDTLRTAPSQVDIGTRLTNLIAAKEKMVRSEVGPKYEELIQNSENAGIVLPAESAAGLLGYVKEEEFKSAFTSFPNLWPKIKKVFADPEEKLYYSLRDLDSLKRETNAALRDSMPGTGEYRILTGLKKQVDAAIDSTDPSFADAYRAIDKEYATRVGMPFNVAGVAQIDRAKFVEQTVPVLTKRASSLKQAMDIIGDSPEGKKIVEDAFLFDIGANRSIISTTTGQLNAPQLKRYIAQNKDKIDMVPGLRDRLEGLGARVNELKANRTAILDAEKNASIEKIDNLWTQSYGETGGIRGVVRKALTNPAELDKLVSLAGNDNIAKAGIKRAMIEDVLSAQGDRVSLINENKQAFEKVFGKDQAKYIVDIVEASQRLKDNPFAMRININTISKTGWQDLTGSKMETSLGEARNQIMTAPRVFINHLGRYFNNQTDKSEAVEVQKFLLDSNALKDAAEFMTTLNTRGFDERAKNLMGKLMKNSAANYLFGAITGGVVGSQAETTKSNFDPALLEGFGEVPK